MIFKLTTVLFFMAFLVIVKANIISTPNATILPQIDFDKFKMHIDQFKTCIDQYLAGVTGDVDESPLKPVLSVIGDQVGRFAKAWDVLTKPSTSPDNDY